MQPKRTLDEGISRKIRLILLTFIIFILMVFIFWAQAHWIFFVILFLMLTIIFTMLFWQRFAVPDLGFTDHILLTKTLMMNQFTRSSMVLSIINGEIEGDYLLLKNKPNIKILNIDSRSAVLIENSTNQRTLLSDGVHIFSKNPKIIAVFYLGIRCLKIGPRDRNDLGAKQSSESLAEYHLRKETVERSRTRLASGDFIYPSFSIFYRIEPVCVEKIEVERFQGIREKIGGSDSDLISIEKMDDFIVFHLLKKWKTFCENKSQSEILSEFPYSFEISSFNEIGIRSRIMLDQIY
jgi:hypothetical protein